MFVESALSFRKDVPLLAAAPVSSTKRPADYGCGPPQWSPS
jgi:hypothetical protein